MVLGTGALAFGPLAQFFEAHSFAMLASDTDGSVERRVVIPMVKMGQTIADAVEWR